MNTQIKQQSRQIEHLRKTSTLEKERAADEMMNKEKMYKEEIASLRTSNMEKDRKISELSKTASQYNSTKLRMDNYQKEVETLRVKLREET